MNGAVYFAALVCTGNPLLSSFIAIGAVVYTHRLKELLS